VAISHVYEGDGSIVGIRIPEMIQVGSGPSPTAQERATTSAVSRSNERHPLRGFRNIGAALSLPR
jgi:hypothetical protein